MRRLIATAILSLCLLAVAACERDRRPDSDASDGGTRDSAVAEQERVSPWAFEAGGEHQEEIFRKRLPGEDGRIILVPATSLLPGAAAVDSGIENPYAGDADAIAAGERHFAAFNCAGCHAPLGGGGMGPPLTDDDWVYGGEPAQIYLSIMHGRGQGMPAWGAMLPQKVTWELVTYIETLSGIEDYAAELGFSPNINGYSPHLVPRDGNGDEE